MVMAKWDLGKLKVSKVDRVSCLEVIVSVMEDELDALHEKVKALEVKISIQEVLETREKNV
jgi:hypothetical protein